MFLIKDQFDLVYLIYGFSIFILFIGVRFLLSIVRKRSLVELNNLLYLNQNFKAYQNLLNNKRLRIAFRKQSLDLMRLKGYLLEGNQENTEKYISKLDSEKLEPYERLDFYQKRFSYFVEKDYKEEAKISLNLLRNLLRKTKNKTAKSIITEAELIYDIYIIHNHKLIPELIQKAEAMTDRVLKGITEYRIAKLYYYQNNIHEVNIYLEKAKENVKGTYWYPIVLEAVKDHQVLSYK